jgi:ferritin-like metal-binding protein YciE
MEQSEFRRRSHGKMNGKGLAMADAQETGRTIFVTGLRNAHAVENQALSLMKRQVERIENYPQVADRLRLHIEETNGQIRRLDDILKSLGEDSSTLKDAGLSLLGNMAAMTHAVAQDEILKNSFANFAFENFEIAAYKSLMQVAELTGHASAVPLLQQTLQEEMEMARWLDSNMSAVTATYLEREQRGLTAGI